MSGAQRSDDPMTILAVEAGRTRSGTPIAQVSEPSCQPAESRQESAAAEVPGACRQQRHGGVARDIAASGGRSGGFTTPNRRRFALPRADAVDRRGSRAPGCTP